MANHSQDFYRGLILRDERFNGSNATVSPPEQQGNPRVGEPQVTGGQGQMDLEATGYSTPEQKFDIRCVKPGYAKGEEYSARFAWKPQSESDTNYRGWFPYSSVTGVSIWRRIVSSSEIPNAWPNAITSEDGWVHLVYQEKHRSGAGLGADFTAVATLNPNTDTWTIVDVTAAVAAQITLNAVAADILELPSGRILLINVAGQVVYSDDRGTTWSTIQAETTSSDDSFGFLVTDLPGAGVHSFIRMHAVYHNGYITCIVEKDGAITETSGSVDRREIDHYVSKDFGISWKLIDRFQPEWEAGLTGSGTSSAKVYDPQLTVDALGQVVLVYADNPDNADANRRLKYSRKRTPYARFADSNDFDKNLGSASPAGNFILCKTQDGFLTVIRQGGMTEVLSTKDTGSTYIYQYDTRDLSVTNTDTRNQGAVQGISTTGGKQFELLLQDGELAADWASSTEVEKLNLSAATPYKGGILFWTVGYTNKEAGTNASPGRGAHVLITLGGYSNYDMPTRGGASIWIATETPDQIAAESAKLGATVTNTTFSITDEGCEFDQTVSGSSLFTFGDSSVSYARAKGLTAPGTSGGNITGPYAYISARGCQLRFGKEKAQVWDTSASPDAAISAVVDLPDEFLDWVVTVDADKVPWVMYKKPNEQTWTKIATTANIDTLSNGTGFGCTGSSFKSVWLYSGINDAVTDVASEWKKASYHPSRLYGRNLSLYPVHLSDGWSIESKGAVAFVGDHWKAETDYGHAVRLMHPEIAASPRIDWQSTTDKSEVSIEWNPASGTDTRPLGGAVGVHLQKVNFKTAYFEGWDGGSWQTLGTVNTAEHFSGLKFARDGNILRPNPAVTHGAGRYIKLEELTGCTAVIAPGTGSETRHNIDHNSEGSFSATAPTAHAKQAEILIDGSVSSVTSTGDFEIWEDRATVIIWERMTAYDKFRLRIPAQDTKDGFFKIGACVIGPLLVFGTDYSWGRSIAYDPNQEITTARAGDRIVEELGPIRRKVQFAWAEGWDARPIGGEAAALGGSGVTDFDTLNLGTTTGVGVRDDPFVMSGAMYRLRAAAEPTVYLPKIPHFVNNTTQAQILGRDRQIYGRIVSPVTQTSILGDEEESEVITINQIVIEEEV